MAGGCGRQQTAVYPNSANLLSRKLAGVQRSNQEMQKSSSKNQPFQAP